MNMLFLNRLISDKIIQAICWTLFHSLWQGALLAIIAAMIITITRRSKPSTRYNLLAVLLIIFVAAAAFTFIRELSILEKIRVATTPLPTESLTINSGNFGTQTDQLSTTIEVSYFDKITQFLNQYASLVVAAWFIFFSIKLTRMIFNVRYIQRVRYSQTFEPSPYWKRRIIELAQILGIDCPIILLESSIIMSPMVIGLFKPVILIPLGLLSNLPAEQVEAVLLHELAHIRRNDYIANLLQTFSEVIFFFNPAVIWISSLLRQERENCCDDISINLTKNKKQFIYALVAFQEFMLQQNSAIEVAFAGERKYLLNRVKRIIYNENKKLNAMEKGMFILSIVIISLVGLAAIRHVPSQNANKFVNSIFSNAALDTVPPKKEIQQGNPTDIQTEIKNITSVTNMESNRKITTIIATDKNGKIYKLTTKNEELVELYVNNKKIPQEELGNYKQTIVAIEREAEAREKENMAKMKMDQADQEKKLMQLNAEREELTQKLNAIDEERAKLDYDKNGFDELRAKLYQDKSWQLQNRNWDDPVKQDLLKELQEKMATQQKLFDLEGALKFKSDSAEQQMNLANKEHLEDLLQNQLEMSQKYNLLLNEKNPFNDNNALEALQQRSNVLIDPVIEEMVQEKIILPDQEEISFELNSKSFIVNGKKQNADVHQRFKNRFLKDNGDYIKFSRKNGHTSTSINLN